MKVYKLLLDIEIKKNNYVLILIKKISIIFLNKKKKKLQAK